MTDDCPGVYSSRLDRAYGTLLGQCVGDALGAQVEFSTAESIRRRFPNGVREMAGGGPFNLLPGQITDDSELALALARTIARIGHFDPHEVARAYVAWRRSSPFDIGGTCSNALSVNLRDDIPAADQVHWAALGRKDSQANGALMRVSPIGISTVRTSQTLAEQFAEEDAALTHPNKVCQIASAAFVVAIRSYVLGFGDESIDRSFEYARRKSMEGHSEVFAVLSLARNVACSAEADGGKQGWVLVALQNAFYQAMNAPSFEEGLVSTINLGGDTDTNAAIAGALLGAKFGAQSIPERWAEPVLTIESPRPETYHTNDLPVLAEQLLRGPPR